MELNYQFYSILIEIATNLDSTGLEHLRSAVCPSTLATDILHLQWLYGQADDALGSSLSTLGVLKCCLFSVIGLPSPGAHPWLMSSSQYTHHLAHTRFLINMEEKKEGEVGCKEVRELGKEEAWNIPH